MSSLFLFPALLQDDLLRGHANVCMGTGQALHTVVGRKLKSERSKSSKSYKIITVQKMLHIFRQELTTVSLIL